MKKYGFSAVMAVILGLSAFGVADAQRRGPVAGFGGRGPLAGMSGVELTDQQREQISAIRQEHRASGPEQPSGVSLHMQLRVELLADSPDEQKIAALRDQILAGHAARLTRDIGLQQKIAAVLTPEQRAKAREAVGNSQGRRSPRQFGPASASKPGR